MRTVQRKTASAFGGLIVVLYIAAVISLFTACASAPRGGTQLSRDAEMCARSGGCTVVQITNDGLSDANIYLGGGRIGFAPGMKDTPLFIPDSRIPDGCVSLFIRLNAIGLRTQSDRFQTTRECVRRGDYFELRINPLLSTSYLVPRRAR